jgi:hypothetical protein
VSGSASCPPAELSANRAPSGANLAASPAPRQPSARFGLQRGRSFRIGGTPDPIAVTHGIGSARADAFELTDPAVGIRWYAAPPTGVSCTITITLQPVGVVMASAEVDAWDGGDEFWPRGGTQPPDGDHWVEVDTDCSWSLRVVWIIG